MSTCTDIDAALSSLSAKIDAIPRVDEQSIINKASGDAQAKLKPDIAAVGVTAAGAVITANQSQTIASIAKELADDAARLARPLVSRVGALAGQVAGLLGRFGGVILAITNIVATIASYAILQTQINSLQAENRALREYVNAAFAQANAAMAAANEAGSIANFATGLANTATTKANFAIAETKVIAQTLNKTTELANLAAKTADQAIYDASVANGKANDAVFKATAAVGRAKLAEVGAIVAVGKSDTAILKSNQATEKADIAVGKSNVATAKADQAVGRSNFAVEQANNASALANSAIQQVNGLGASLRAEFDTKINYANFLTRALENKLNGLFGNVAANNSAASSAKSTADKANANSLKIYEPKIFNQQLRNAGIVQPLNLAQARVEIKNTLARDFKFTANTVRPLTLEQARAEFKRTIDRDYKFNLNAVRPVSIADARAEVQRQLGNVRAENQRQLGALGEQIRATARGLQGQVANFVIPAASAASPAVMERAIARSPTVTGLKGELTQVKANQGSIQAVNTQANEKLDRIDAKLGPITANTANNIPSIQRVEDIVQSMVPQINDFVKDLKNFGNQINVTINKINIVINQLTDFIQNVNEQLRSILNYLVAAAVILTFIQAQVVVLVTNVAIIGTRLLGLVKWLALDRVLGLLNFLANLHNASMLTCNLKVTLLEMLSSVGNATGLLQTSDNENIELNKVFDQGIETFVVGVVGVDTYAQMKLAWRTYNPIFRAASNSLSQIGNMFSSIGNGIEVIGERTGKVGNAIMAARLVPENAYNYMSEKINVHTSKFMTFQSKIGGVTQFVEAINEVAETVIEGQQSYNEAENAKKAFRLELAKLKKKDSIDPDNEEIKKEAEAIKKNLAKDPTGEPEKGLLSFLTDK